MPVRKASQWAHDLWPPGLPPSQPVELGDQGEEAVLGRMDVSGQGGDLVAEVLERIEMVVGCGRET